MKRLSSSNRPLLVTCAAITISSAAASSARADRAADAFDAWNAAFLVTTGGSTYYSTTVTTAGTTRSGTWVGALDIAVAEDAYQNTHSAADRQLVSDLVTTFIAKEGTSWNGDTWNDDIAWMVIAVLRGYQITGNPQFLMVAETNWNMAYDRGWDTKYGGGGVWEDMNHVTPVFNQPSKCNLSNNPLIKTGLVLYRMTGDSTYLVKSQGMYAWIRKTLFDAQTGLVNECLAFKTPDDTAGFVQTSDNAYNSGSFLEAADGLYRATGDQSYLDDAVLAINHRIAKEPIMHDGGQGERQWQYRILRGLTEFANYHDKWSTYQTWLQNNANAAWTERDSLNITWNDWTQPTPLPGANGVTHDNDVVPLCTSSAAAVWQMFPPASSPSLSGIFEIRNSASQLSLTVGGASTGAAVVQQAFSGDAFALWNFVPGAGGYFAIQNVGSGLVIQIDAGSYALGAQVTQGRPAVNGQGNDWWLPVDGGDGSYFFYNLASTLALDDPGQSAAAETQFDQWAGNGTAAQKFTLIPHAVSGDGGADAGSTNGDGSSQTEADASTATDGPAGPSDAAGMPGAGGTGAINGAGGANSLGGAGVAGGVAGSGGASSQGTSGQGQARGCMYAASPSSGRSSAGCLLALSALIACRRRGRPR
jgi:predicted alpha-1,6-mannanase (GH76 family)